MLWLVITGCASWLGLQELEQLPAGFPLAIDGPTGKITRADSGQVAVDLPFAEELDARARWQALREQAVASGFRVTLEGHRDKMDRITLDGTGGRLELACCRQRADRQHLVFVSWWPTQP